jgi:hypothetical protein
MRIPFQKRKCKHREKGGIDDPYLLGEYPILAFHKEFLESVAESCGIQDLRIYLFQTGGKRDGAGAGGPESLVIFGDDPVDVVSVFVKPVIAQLIPDPEQDEQGTCHSYSQAGYIYEGVSLVSSDISHGDYEVVSKHGCTPIERIFNQRGNQGEDLNDEPQCGDECSSASPDLTELFVEILQC